MTERGRDVQSKSASPASVLDVTSVSTRLRLTHGLNEAVNPKV